MRVGHHHGRGREHRAARSRSPRCRLDRTSTTPRPTRSAARAVNVSGTEAGRAAGRAGRLLLDRLRLRRTQAGAVRRVRPARSAVGVRALEARRRAGDRRGLDRPDVVAVRLDGSQLRPHDARARAGNATRCGSSTTSAAARPTSGISPRRPGELVELPYGLYHVAADGDCTWAEFAEAIFEEAGLSCRVVRISTEELGRPAPRPAYSVLRSEKPDDAPPAALARGPARVSRASRGLTRA